MNNKHNVSPKKHKNKNDNLEKLYIYLNHDTWNEYSLKDIALINPKSDKIPEKFNISI